MLFQESRELCPHLLTSAADLLTASLLLCFNYLTYKSEIVKHFTQKNSHFVEIYELNSHLLINNLQNEPDRAALFRDKGALI